jgi:hypothetical protein
MDSDNEENENLFREFTEETPDNSEEIPKKPTKAQTKPIKIIRPPERSAQFYRDFNKINEFKRVFAKQCEEVNLKGSETWGDEEAAEVLDRCKMLTSSSNSGSAHRIAFKCALGVAENRIAPMLRMDITGFAELAGNDPAILQALDEAALVNDWNFTMTPEQRLVMGLATLAVRLDAVNKREAAASGAAGAAADTGKKAPSVEELQEQFNGL